MHHNISKEHFKFVHHNVSAYVMNEGKSEYATFRKINLNSRVSLSHSNVFAKGSSMGSFSNEGSLGFILPGTLISHEQGG